MKNIHFYIVLLFAIVASCTLSACGKGADDPILSLKSRKDRFTNSWTLNKYTISGTTQDLNGTAYQYVVDNNGTLTRTTEGEIFGFPIRLTSDGTWTFTNNDKDVKITIGSETTTYGIQRLANKELWLTQTRDNKVYTYYFDGL